MELLQYKYKNSYEIQVSSTDISASWNKFRVRTRHFPPEKYCSYSLQEGGKLELFNPDTNCLEIVEEEDWANSRPIFFEDHKYTLSFTFFDAVDEPKIIHPNK